MGRVSVCVPVLLFYVLQAAPHPKKTPKLTMMESRVKTKCQ